MRAWVITASLLIALSAFGEKTFTVRGGVNFGDGALPGCTVTLRGEAVRNEVSNAEGRYTFRNVPPGDYTLEFFLEGFTRASRDLRVSSDVDVQQQEVEVDEANRPITLACGGPPCTDTNPETAYGLPRCRDYELDEMLIESAKGGDRSAIDYLRKRFESAETYQQKNRIAAALLGRVPDDRAYWNELATHANDAIRFAYVNDKPTPEFEQWCADHKVDVQNHHSMLADAFRLASEDTRSRPLLRRALDTTENWLLIDAILGMQQQHDPSALTEIGKAIARFPDDLALLTEYLVYFESEEADELALSMLDDEGKASYRRQRDEYRRSIVEYELNR